MANSNIYKMADATLVRFLELYRSEECLWNTNHKDYKTKHLRSQAMERIANQLNIAGFGPAEVAHKFKNIRSNYCQELKRIFWSIQRGDDEIYKPKVIWFSVIDSFLKPYCQVQLTSKDGNMNEDCKELIEINDIQLVKVSSVFQVDSRTSDVGSAIINTSNCKGEQSTELNTTKKCRMDNPEYVTLKEDPTNDDYDAFGRFVATQLRELSQEYAVQAQRAILQCLAEERLHSYEKNVNTDKDYDVPSFGR